MQQEREILLRIRERLEALKVEMQGVLDADDDLVLSSEILTTVEGAKSMFQKKKSILDRAREAVSQLQEQRARAWTAKDKAEAALEIVHKPRDPAAPAPITIYDRGKWMQATVTGATIAREIGAGPGTSYRETEEYHAAVRARMDLCDVDLRLNHALAVVKKLETKVADLKVLMDCLEAA